MTIHPTESDMSGVWKKDGCWCPEEIDAAFPWLGALFPAWTALRDSATWPSCEQYNQNMLRLGITNQQGQPIQFVPQPSKRFMRKNKNNLPGYNEYIHTEGKVFTRQENWHDLFNMLIWSTLPQTKSAIHEQQHHESLDIDPSSGVVRNSTQDLLTRLDEGGVLLACSPHWYTLLQCEELRYIIWGRWLPPCPRSVPQTRTFSDQEEARQHGLRTCAAYLSSLPQTNPSPEGSESPLFPPGCEDMLWHQIVSGEMFHNIAFCFVGHGLFEVMLAKRWDVRAGAFLFSRPASWFAQPATERQRDLDQSCTEVIRNKTLKTKVPCVGIPLGILTRML